MGIFKTIMSSFIPTMIFKMISTLFLVFISFFLKINMYTNILVVIKKLKKKYLTLPKLYNHNFFYWDKNKKNFFYKRNYDHWITLAKQDQNQWRELVR